MTSTNESLDWSNLDGVYLTEWNGLQMRIISAATREHVRFELIDRRARDDRSGILINSGVAGDVANAKAAAAKVAARILAIDHDWHKPPRESVHPRI